MLLTRRGKGTIGPRPKKTPMTRLEHVRLGPHSVFKRRYGQWYLIDAWRKDRERMWVQGGSEEILLDLFRGMSVGEVLRRYDVTRKALEGFLRGLIAEGYVEAADLVSDSSAKCFDLDPPLDCLYVRLTNVCNLRCEHCLAESGKPMRGELDGPEWIGLLRQAEGLGAFEVTVSGGEPTLHPDFREICAYLSSVQTFNPHLNTNGVGLDGSTLDLIAQTFRSVQVSLDSAEPFCHDLFRGRRGAHAEAVRTIRGLVERGLDVSIGFSLTAKSLNCMGGVADLAESLGVSILNIGLVAGIGRARGSCHAFGCGSADMGLEGFADRLFAKLRELERRQGSLKLLLPFRIDRRQAESGTPKRFICDGENRQILYVMPDGDFMPCDKMPASEFAAGNVRTHALAQTWTSDKMRSFKLMSPKQLPVCGPCKMLVLCGGSCVARAYHEHGSIGSPDPVSCAMARRLSQDISSK